MKKSLRVNVRFPAMVHPIHHHFGANDDYYIRTAVQEVKERPNLVCHS